MSDAPRARLPLWEERPARGEASPDIASRLAAAPGCVGILDAADGQLALRAASQLSDAWHAQGHETCVWVPGAATSPLAAAGVPLAIVDAAPPSDPPGPWLAVGPDALARVAPWCLILLTGGASPLQLSELARSLRPHCQLVLDEPMPSLWPELGRVLAQTYSQANG